MESVPGVGPVLATTLMALVPELGRLSGKEVAALVGVAPFARNSGTHRGRRCVGGGLIIPHLPREERCQPVFL